MVSYISLIMGGSQLTPLVKVYSTPTWPWCHKAKKFLSDNNVSFQDLNVASDEAARKEMIERTGKRVVPVVEVDGEVMVGYDEKWLREKLSL